MALPLRKPEPITTPLEHFELLHTPDQYGTAVLWEREGRGKRWHKLTPDDPHIPALLRAQVGTRDGFLTVNEFHWWRQVDNLKSLRSLYVDIDRNLTLEDIADALHQAKLPMPSLIVWSGRGVHLYWLHAPTPARALPVWQRCQDVIVKALTFAGADPAAKDCARVLRLCGTINAKNGVVVQGRVFDPVPWPFHDLCDEILGPRPEPKAAQVRDLATARADRGQRLRTGSIYDWWHLVYRDLLAIADKHWFGGIPHGHRDNFLFLSSVALSWFAHPTTLEAELTRRAQTWTPGLKVSEVKAGISSSLKRAQRAAAGEKVLWQGQERDPRYWFKRETLHGLMEPLIDAELAPTLRAIIPTEVRQERRKARFAARWSDHNTGTGVRVSNEKKRATARLMREQGQPVRTIATELGVSVGTVHNWTS
jgi:hypothetical protein